MNKSFGRIISSLRKEKGISQKQVAKDLNISQALLSHYEKGIRECSLDFAVKTADYFGVSCDYLLGRTPERNGAMLSSDDIEEYESEIGKNSASMLPTLNKKILRNTLEYVYSLLIDINDKDLTSDISNYLMTSVYKTIRLIDGINIGDKEFFSISEDVYSPLTDALHNIYEGKVKADTASLRKKNKELTQAIITHKSITEDHKPLASSVLNLVHNTEKNLMQKIKL
ncbi:MAG: helix-turn-helix domain-containing protein [Acutalibacteraceae bacterium]